MTGAAPDYAAGFDSFPLDAEGAATLDVAGSLPAWLDGTLVRNGPGLFAVGDRDLTHWFDGLALLRRYGFGDGAVEYAVRYLRSEAFAAARDGRLAHDQFATPADGGPLARLRRLVDPTLTDNASVSVARVGDRVAAVTETPRMVAFDPATLETRGTFEHDDGVDATGTLGHVHHDPRRGEYVTVGVDFGRTSEYLLLRRDEGATAREVVGRYPVDRPSYVHSFALTDRYAVLTECPFVTSPLALLRADAFVDAYAWRPDAGTRFLVLDRETGSVVARPRTDPFFTFHHANAHHRDGDLVVDLVAYPDDRAVRDLDLPTLRSTTALPAGEFRRYRFDPTAPDPTPTAERLHPGPAEFPTIAYADRNGRPYRYCYLATAPDGGLPDRVTKVDVERGRSRTWLDPGTYPGEPLFVPRPDGDEEDDGVLLVELLDATADETALVVLDAGTLDERARVTTPRRLPLGFHGQYLDGSGRRSMA